MKPFFAFMSLVLITSCIKVDQTVPTVISTREAKIVWMRSVKGNKEVSICSPKLQNEDARVFVELICEDDVVLTLRTYEMPYGSRATAEENIRIYWRDDGNAVVVNFAEGSGSQETSPIYVVWNGNSAANTTYKTIQNENYVGGESTIFFNGWKNSGEPIFVSK